MKRSLIIFLLLSFLSQNICVAQFKKQLDSLCVLCNKLTSDSEKVVALGKLADLYYTFKLNKQGDSILKQQLLIADLANNNNLILLALFGDAINNINSSTTTEEFDKTIQFLVNGINYAKFRNQYDYLALGYTRMANILRNRGQYDKALSNANLAIQQLSNIKYDSVKAVVYIELGNCYQARSESVLASTNYNIAFDIALKIKSIPLQSEVYHCFSEMYRMLGNMDVAKEELKKSLVLNKEYNNGEGLVRDYYDLARVTDEKLYIDKTLALADSLHLYKYILGANELMFFYIMVVEKNSDKALHYLETETDLKESYINVSMANYYGNIGHVYFYSNKADSALYYYKLAEYDYLNNFDQKSSKIIFNQIAKTYQLLNDVPNAINYYTKVLALSAKMNDIKSIASASAALGSLYEDQKDFKQAFIYSKQAVQYQDSLRKLSEGKDIALLNVERENRKHAQDLKDEELRVKNKTNIQYMAITIAIAVVFIIMLIIGMFPVSKLTIKMLGYFFFISLFEFIVLLIDNILLVKAVHGEPLKIWLVKIVLIALLVPLQHYMEHSLIKFLESRKLLQTRTKFSFKKWRQKISPPTPVIVTGIEDDTAVL